MVLLTNVDWISDSSKGVLQLDTAEASFTMCYLHSTKSWSFGSIDHCNPQCGSRRESIYSG